jgi:hypothetical protein
MDALPKAKMPMKLACNFQFVWLSKLGLIVIRRHQHGKEHIPSLDLLPGDLDIFGGKTRSRCSGWSIEAQQFFDRRRNETEVRFELL